MPIDISAIRTLPRENLVIEAESTAYGAQQFTLNAHRILFRVSKITPKKMGQFVTLWKRLGSGPIQPFEATDAFDFIVIEIRENERDGYFVFPKSVLVEKNIFSKNNLGGKRAMRLYAPWHKADNRQAKNTQAWQIQYFLSES